MKQASKQTTKTTKQNKRKQNKRRIRAHSLRYARCVFQALTSHEQKEMLALMGKEAIS